MLAVNDVLAKELESDNQKTRTKAVQELIKLRLASLESHGANKKLCLDPEPITNAEYQFFVDQMRESEGRYYQPDHWTSYSYPKGQALEPILGIRSQDALAFCKYFDWANGKYSSVRYRLPLVNETTEPSLADNKVFYWYYDGYSYRLKEPSSEATQNLAQQFRQFLGNTSLELPADFFVVDRNATLDDHIFNPTSTNKIDYAQAYNRTHLSNLRTPLAAILNLHYGYPTSRDMFVCTSYDSAHISDLAMATSKARHRQLDISIEVEKDFSLNRFIMAGFTEVTGAMQQANIQQAVELIKQLSKSEDIYEKRWSSILADYLKIYQAENFAQLRYGYRHYTMHIALFAFIGYKSFLIPGTRPDNFQWAMRRKELPIGYRDLLFIEEKDRLILEERILADLYWQMVILIAREQGRLPAWEGIRLVREIL